MPKVVNKRTNDRNLNTNKLSKSIKSVDPNDESYWSRWTAGDGFQGLGQNPDKSSSNNSTDSSISSKRSVKSTSNESKQTTPTKLMSTYRSPKMNAKSLLQLNSRFATRLEETNDYVVSDNYVESQSLPQIQTQTEMFELSQSISNMSSPIKQSACETKISPTSSPNMLEDAENGELTYNQLVINYLDQIEECFKYRNECNNTETSLQTRAKKVFKNIKQSRLEFCQIHSFKLDDSKALTLKLTKIEAKFGLTVVHSLVFDDQNSKYSQNTKVLLLLNDSLTTDLKLNSVIKLYLHWTEVRLKKFIILFNAFNIEMVESSEYFDENNEDMNEDMDETIWPNEKLQSDK